MHIPCSILIPHSVFSIPPRCSQLSTSGVREIRERAPRAARPLEAPSARSRGICHTKPIHLRHVSIPEQSSPTRIPSSFVPTTPSLTSCQGFVRLADVIPSRLGSLPGQSFLSVFSTEHPVQCRRLCSSPGAPGVPRTPAGRATSPGIGPRQSLFWSTQGSVVEAIGRAPIICVSQMRTRSL